ncbi:hypothetical protein P280DRAFT_64843 [Massarina eburnea CBS 473.64]|uniref:Uncharacterized protein n=1 Tax=Massarina eburnea CBS 473.64 TaxID=1395130 RepID=A0A6A6RXG7_9PLEO|nr:hypothetical protein P280DRAFT_64843 [Massarina eburnea CBS 473.64]
MCSISLPEGLIIRFFRTLGGKVPGYHCSGEACLPSLSICKAKLRGNGVSLASTRYRCPFNGQLASRSDPYGSRVAVTLAFDITMMELRTSRASICTIQE